MLQSRYDIVIDFLCSLTQFSKIAEAIAQFHPDIDQQKNVRPAFLFPERAHSVFPTERECCNAAPLRLHARKEPVSRI